MSYQAIDFFRLEDQLTSEEKLIQQSAREFTEHEVMPLIAHHFEQGTFPKKLIPLMAELGFLGSTIHGYGCAGVGDVAYGLIMTEIERGDSGLRSFVSVQSSLCMYPIDAFGSEAMKKKYLPEMAQGKLIGCFGLTEPDFGSNPAGMAMRAKKDGAHYILNGSKMWITNGGIADLAIVWARDDEDKVRGFVVEKGTKGFSSRDIEMKFSLRASVTSELIFEDCKVPASQLLEVSGLKGPFSCLNNARYGISWGVIGAAQACFDEALRYSKTRIQFDQPIASYQLVQAKLVKMFTEISKAQLMSYHLGRLREQKKNSPVSAELIAMQTSMAKMNNVAMALDCARVTRDILGASGITYEYQVGRHLLNLESVNTYEGTEDIHRLILGQYITGIPAFRVDNKRSL